jgi:hypothetical protein
MVAANSALLLQYTLSILNSLDITQILTIFAAFATADYVQGPLYSKFPTPSTNGSLATAIQPKPEEHLRQAATYFSPLYKKK